MPGYKMIHLYQMPNVPAGPYPKTRAALLARSKAMELVSSDPRTTALQRLMLHHAMWDISLTLARLMDRQNETLTIPADF
jgi:hypothetical protein